MCRTGRRRVFYLQSEAIINPRLVAFKLNSLCISKLWQDKSGEQQQHIWAVFSHTSRPLHSGLIWLFWFSFNVSSDCFYMNMPHFKILLFFFFNSVWSSFQTAKTSCLWIRWVKVISTLIFSACIWRHVFTFVYLHDLDECFQLVHVELQVQSVCQPNTHRLRGAGVPLLNITNNKTKKTDKLIKLWSKLSVNIRHGSQK